MVTTSQAAIGGCGKFTRSPRPLQLSLQCDFRLDVAGKEVSSEALVTGARAGRSARLVPCYDSIIVLISLDSMLSPQGGGSSS